ncbi:MAG: helix-hairpin-helix domain-containing protein [Chloroflexia bacterium]
MLRWLLRLLIIGLVLFVVTRAVARMLGGEEDFDDYDDIEAGFEFTETPVEIDVPAGDTSSIPTMSSSADSFTASDATAEPSTSSQPDADRQALIDINGIGPTYASRLMDAGINTVDDLARADAGDLADKLDVIGGRATVENWITQAQGMTSEQSNT